MGFLARKIKNNIYIYLETYSPEKRQKILRRSEWPLHGFSEEMSLDQIKERCKSLNTVTMQESLKKRAIVARMRDKANADSVYVQPDRNASFIQELEETYADNPARLKEVLKTWNVAKEVIIETKTFPHQFFQERNKFQNLFRNRAYSPDYIKRIIWLINKFGEHIQNKNNQFFKPLPKISAVTKAKIIEKRDEMDGIKRAAETFTLQELVNLKGKFEDEGLLQKWNWLFLAFAFGLRPQEVKWLLKQRVPPISRDAVNNVDVLNIYQAKLTSVPLNERTKQIPIYTEEQRAAVLLLKTPSEIEVPLNKTLKRMFKANIQLYSPRKSFTDYMLSQGFELEDISQFLGHRSIEMTWRHYKSKKQFKLPKKTG